MGKASEIWKEIKPKIGEMLVAVNDIETQAEKAQEEAYQLGLTDAWDAARKIANMPYDEEEKVFGSGGWAFIENHTASEAIEKIRQYEQEKDRQARIEYNCEEIKDVINTTMRECNVSLDEIASVLEKMRESK